MAALGDTVLAATLGKEAHEGLVAEKTKVETHPKGVPDVRRGLSAVDRLTISSGIVLTRGGGCREEERLGAGKSSPSSGCE